IGKLKSNISKQSGRYPKFIYLNTPDYLLSDKKRPIGKVPDRLAFYLWCSHYLDIICKYYTPNQLIFINKNAKNERSLLRLYEYSFRDIRACKNVIFI